MSNFGKFSTREEAFKNIIIDSQLLVRNLNEVGLFKKLIEANALTATELRDVVLQPSRDSLNMSCLDENVELMHYVVVNKIVSFKELIDEYKGTLVSGSSLWRLLRNGSLFEKLIDSSALTQEDLRYLLNKIHNKDEIGSLCENTLLLSYIVSILSFQELIDFFKETKDEISHKHQSSLFQLTQNLNPFAKWIESDMITNDDLKYLLNKIENFTDLRSLCEHGRLMRKILNEFVLDKEIVDKFNKVLRKNKKVHNIFELIQECNRYNSELLELNSLNKLVYVLDLNKEQKLEIAKVVKDNEIVLNKLKYVVDNNLEDAFENFEELMNYLKKQEKRLSINI